MSSKNWLAGVSYDLNGNALAVNAFALTCDAENRLGTATSGSAVESYFYDENNHRVEKIFGSSDYIYFYGPGGRLLSIREVTNGTTSVVADRVYFGGLLLGSAGNGPSYDVSTMTDRLGTAVAGYPYGTDIGSVSAGNDQADFATYTRDSTTGFEYANQRYYSAGLGRFLTKDPYSGSGVLTDPTSLNRYSYVEDDPINGNDPSGRCPALFGGVGMTMGDTSPFSDFADSIGSDTGYPFGSGGFIEDVLGVVAQTVNPEYFSLTVGGATLYSALSEPGGVTLIGYSGGAQTATVEANGLSSVNKQSITGAIYIDPGNVGDLFNVPKNTVIVTGSGFTSNAVRFLANSYQNSVPIIPSKCAHTDFQCFVNALENSDQVPASLKNVLNGNTPCANRITYGRKRKPSLLPNTWDLTWRLTPGPPVGPDNEGRIPPGPEEP